MNVLTALLKTITICIIAIMITIATIITGGGLILAAVGVAVYCIARDA